MATPGLTWTWDRAFGPDVPAIMDMTRELGQESIEGIWQIDDLWFGQHLMVDVVRQFWNPGSAFVAVARADHTGDLLGYLWAERGIKTFWCEQEMVNIKMVQPAAILRQRDRVRMVEEMMDLWERWAREIGVGIVCSGTIRHEQAGFLRLHERRGYDRRGSVCYRRVLPMPASNPASRDSC